MRGEGEGGDGEEGKKKERKKRFPSSSSPFFIAFRLPRETVPATSEKCFKARHTPAKKRGGSSSTRPFVQLSQVRRRRGIRTIYLLPSFLRRRGEKEKKKKKKEKKKKKKKKKR